MADESKKAERVPTGGKEITISLNPAKHEVLVAPDHHHNLLQPGFLRLEVDPTNVKRLSVRRNPKSGKITIHLD